MAEFHESGVTEVHAISTASLWTGSYFVLVGMLIGLTCCVHQYFRRKAAAEKTMQETSF